MAESVLRSTLRLKTGFTLIELLMVISLVSILATLAVVGYIDFGKDARTAVTQDRMNQIKMAIVGDPRLVSAGQYSKPGFITHCLSVPSAMSDLATIPLTGVCSLDYNPFTRQGWKGPYVSSSDVSWMNDAWGTAFEYDSIGRTIKSCGSDQTCGTGDDITLSF